MKFWPKIIIFIIIIITTWIFADAKMISAIFLNNSPTYYLETKVVREAGVTYSIDIDNITENGYFLEVDCEENKVATLRVRMKYENGKEAVRTATVSGGGIDKRGNVNNKCSISGTWLQKPEVEWFGLGKEMVKIDKPVSMTAEFVTDKTYESSIDFRNEPYEFTSYELHHSIALVQSSGVQTGVNVNTDAFNFTGQPVVGNHIITTVVGWNDGAFDLTQITDNQSNSYNIDIERDDGDVAKAEASITSGRVVNSSGTFTMTVDPQDASGNYIVWATIEFSGMASTSWLDRTGSSAGASGSTSSTATASAGNTRADDLVVAAIAVSVDDTNINVTDPANTGYTSIFVNQDSNATIGAQGSYKILTNTETSSANWTHDNAVDGNSSVIATYKAADSTTHVKIRGDGGVNPYIKIRGGASGGVKIR